MLIVFPAPLSGQTNSTVGAPASLLVTLYCALLALSTTFVPTVRILSVLFSLEGAVGATVGPTIPGVAVVPGVAVGAALAPGVTVGAALAPGVAVGTTLAPGVAVGVALVTGGTVSSGSITVGGTVAAGGVEIGGSGVGADSPNAGANSRPHTVHVCGVVAVAGAPGVCG